MRMRNPSIASGAGRTVISVVRRTPSRPTRSSVNPSGRRSMLTAVGTGATSRYPRTANSFAWGVILGAGAYVALLAAQALADRLRDRGAVLAGGLAFAGAFVAYEAVLVAATAVLASGSEAFSLPIVGWVLRVNLLSLAGLLILYRLAVWIGLVTRSPLGARATVTAG